MKMIPVAGPSITEHEIEYVTRAAREGWYEGAGEFHARFEAAFAAYVGRRHAIALPSCTAALHLALAARGIGPGDEVIVPELTWIASSAPIRYVGATPVFADVEPETWCLAPASVEACLSERTRAIIAVDLYGNMPDLDALERLVAGRGIAIIEDAAQAIGSRLRGRLAGSFGLASAFSFHGSKTMTTGEGGMLVTDDDALHERVRVLRDHGRPVGDRRFINTEVAYKYKMSAMQAALGLAQLERIDELVAMKNAIFAGYAQRLGEVEGLTLNRPGPAVRSSHWMVNAVLDPRLGLRSEGVMEALAQRGIDSRPMFQPLSGLPAYAAEPTAIAARRRNLVARGLSPFGVNLPSALVLDPAQVEHVCRSLLDIIEHAVA